MPTKEVTPAEYKVIAYTISLALILIGLLGVGFLIFSEINDHEFRSLLMKYSLVSLSLGLSIIVGHKIIRCLIDG